jgi:hypothetical protein
MIVQNGISCRGFSICYGTMTPNENLVCPNTTNGFFNQWIYLYSGFALAGTESNQTTELIEGTLVDVSQYAGAPIKYVSGNNGATWLGINPIPTTKRYDAKLIKGPVTETINPSDKETFIICVDGIVACNDVQLKATQYVRVVSTSKTLNLSTNGIAIICTER